MAVFIKKYTIIIGSVTNDIIADSFTHARWILGGVVLMNLVRVYNAQSLLAEALDTTVGDGRSSVRTAVITVNGKTWLIADRNTMDGKKNFTYYDPHKCAWFSFRHHNCRYLEAWKKIIYEFLLERVSC